MEALSVLLTGCSATLMTLTLQLLLSVVLLPQKQPPPLKVSRNLSITLHILISVMFTQHDLHKIH